ncbi:MAG: hypothetical protein ED859_03990 [Desulfuromonadales bacterium]|nr:MAG: hypothetical protein ED859_03990 [Desulfuromonadales bacterium]
MAAAREFLSHLHDPGETWIIASVIGITPLIIELIAAHRKGVPLHLYLDQSHTSGKADRVQVNRLADAGVDVTVGTSLVGTGTLSHTKGVVVNGAVRWCWAGSVNFSESGWHAVDMAMVFYSPQWYERFVEEFRELRQYAWDHQGRLQVMKQPPAGVVV